MKPRLPEAYKLLHDGSLAMAELEAAGIRIDVDRLNRTIRRVSKKIKRLTEELKSDPIYESWRKRYGDKTKLSGREQLTAVLDSLGYKLKERTKTQRFKSDESVLTDLNIPFVDKLLELEKCKKLNGTFLQGILNETVDGFLHPFFNLNTTVTYRSSSDTPNFQNFPARNEYASKAVRSVFIPRDGRALAENDFGALEFCIAAIFWDDPEMLSYASDPDKDIHRDQAADCYGIPQNQVSKNARYCAKNKMVFPTLYGSYYKACAKNLWEAIDSMNLETKDGTPIKKVLARKGITKLGKCQENEEPVRGTYEYHVKEVEERFMNRFPVFAEKKEEWWRTYRRRGWFRLMTGFVCKGLYRKNQILNTPIQGPGFHCELWTILRLLKRIRQRKMKSLVVGQIHDCSLGDVPLDELQDYLNLVEHIVKVELRKAWSWITIPLKIEAEVALDNWYNKKEWIKKNGIWGPKDD